MLIHSRAHVDGQNVGCIHDNCQAKHFCLNFCRVHYFEFKMNDRAAHDRLRNLSREDRARELSRQREAARGKWEYAGKENELIAAQEAKKPRRAK